MSQIHPLPELEEVSNTFSALFGEGIKAELVETPADTSHVAVFVNDADEPVSAISVDLPFTAYLGAALTMIPAAGAEDAIKENDVSEMMVANLQEIMNICSRWFMTNESPHLRLTTVYKPDQLPDDVTPLMSADENMTCAITIPDYGQGLITCLTT